MTYGPDPKPIEDRFWPKVQKSDGCWEWQAARNRLGYGVLSKGSKAQGMAFAHRVSYEAHKGSIPEGMVVMHVCDNPPCVNPDHLVVGTQHANILDKMSKGRWAGGQPRRNTPAALSDARAFLTYGFSQRQVLRWYGGGRETLLESTQRGQ